MAKNATEWEKFYSELAVMVLGGVVGNLASSAQNLTARSVSDKLARYLLNPDHPVGGQKAQWFDKALGFTRENAGDLAKQFVFSESNAVQTAVTQYGTKFNQVINVTGANGRVIPVRTAWIRGKDNVVRFVTATPGD
jgi:hypothetical protein